MKKITSFTIDEDIFFNFAMVCRNLESKYKTSFSKSQIIESLIVKWIKKNKED